MISNNLIDFKIPDSNVESKIDALARSISVVFFPRGKEFLDLLEIKDSFALQRTSVHNKVSFIENYINELKQNIAIIKNNTESIDGYYKREIYKIYSYFVGFRSEYSEANYDDIFERDFIVENVIKFLYNRISVSTSFNYSHFFKYSINASIGKGIRYALYKILVAKKHNKKKQNIDELKIIRKKINTLIYSVFPEEDGNVINDDEFEVFKVLITNPEYSCKKKKELLN